MGRRVRPAQSSEPGLLLGTHAVDITPDLPVALAGFASRTARADRVLSRLTARLFAFSDREGTGEAVVLICADLLWWGDALTAELEMAARARYGEGVRLLLHASHTHSGPQTAAGMLPSLGAVDAAYLSRLHTTVLDGVGHALAARRPVAVQRYRGRCDLAVCRRGRDQASGQVREEPTPCAEHAAGQDLTVLVFRGNGGDPVGVLVHYACHPVVHAGNAVSADFPGEAVAELERTEARGALVGFLQGCAGDLNPRLIAGGRFQSGGADEIGRLSGRLTAAARDALAGRPEPIASGPLTHRLTTVRLPLQPPPTVAQLRSAAERVDLVGDWARLLLARPRPLTRTLTLRLHALWLAPEAGLLTMNAEPVSWYGRVVLAASHRRLLALGYTNGMIGYLVTAGQLAEGGYEPDVSTRYFGLPAPFAPSVQAVAGAAIERLIQLGPARHGR